MAGQFRGSWTVRETKPAFNAFSFVSTAPPQKPRKKTPLPEGYLVPDASTDLSAITNRRVLIGDDEWIVKKQTGNRIRVQRSKDGASAWRAVSDIEAMNELSPKEEGNKDEKSSSTSLMRTISIKMKLHNRLQAIRDRHAGREEHVAKLKSLKLESRKLIYHLQGNAEFECAKQSGDRVRLVKPNDGTMFWAHIADVDLTDQDKEKLENTETTKKMPNYECIEWEEERVLVRYTDDGREEWKPIDEVCDDEETMVSKNNDLLYTLRDNNDSMIKETSTEQQNDDKNTSSTATVVLNGLQYETLDWSDDDRVLLKSIQDGISEWHDVSELQDSAKLHNPEDDDIEMAEPPPLSADAPLLQVPSEIDFIFCVYDRDSNFRAYLRSDGHVYNNTNTLIGFVDKDALQAASSQEEYLGEIEQLISGDADVVVADAANEWACFMDLGTALIKDYQGNTVAELKQNGDIFGNAGTFLGSFQGFNYHLIKLVALYLALIDPGMLTEVAVAQDATLDDETDPDRFIRRLESTHLPSPPPLLDDTAEESVATHAAVPPATKENLDDSVVAWALLTRILLFTCYHVPLFLPSFRTRAYLKS